MFEAFLNSIRAEDKERPLSDVAQMEHYAEGRELAGQRLILKMIHAGFREGLLPEGRVAFYCYPEGSREGEPLTNREEAFSQLYNGDMNRRVRFVASRREGGEEPSYTDISSPSQFWDDILVPYAREALGETFEPQNVERAKYEVLNALNSEALAFTARLAMQKEMAEEAQEYNSTWEWLTGAEWPGETRTHFLMAAAAMDGHPLHPMGKMRLRLNGQDELTIGELMSYFAEFGPHFSLPLLALREDQAQIVAQENQPPLRAYFQENYPEAYVAWEAGLTAQGLSSEEYIPIPIHPLNLENVREQFADLAQERALIDTGAEIEVYPMLSTRSLLPVGGGPRLKVTMPDLQLTSVPRSIAPARVHSGPVLSDLLDHVMEQAENFDGTLRIINEPYGVYFHPQGTEAGEEEEVYQRGYHLDYILREDSSALVPEEQIAMPLAALFNRTGRDPETGKPGAPLIVDMLRSRGVATAAQAEEYFADYARIVLEGQLGLFVRYGVSVEGHQQNTKLLFDRDATLQATHVRDLAGGVEIYQPLLESHKGDAFRIAEKLHEGYAYKTLDPDLASPLAQVMHTTLTSHLFPLIDILEEQFGADRAAMTDSVRESIAGVIDRARMEHLPQIREDSREFYLETLDRIENGLLRDMAPEKSLFTMRLLQQATAINKAVTNPFSPSL